MCEDNPEWFEMQISFASIWFAI